MRLLAIGDIHGCLTAFIALLDAVSPETDDQIIFLGDYVDRGPDSRGVLDRLIDLHAGGRVVALRGNHDAMMLEARIRSDPLWLACGGVATLRSYGASNEQIEDAIEGKGCHEELLAGVPARHWQFLEDDCVRFHETEHHIFVHGCVDPKLPLDQQSDDTLYWRKLLRPCAHISGKTMICGHTRQKSGLPLDLGTSICIDTNIYDGGWLTCLDAISRRVWQANELGERRTGSLDEFAV